MEIVVQRVQALEARKELVLQRVQLTEFEEQVWQFVIVEQARQPEAPTAGSG